MVVIKNAVVPPSCYFCPMTNDGFYLCKANNPYKMLEDDCEERRPDWCPLVPVPPHGDLIDRAVLRESFRESIEACHKWADEMREAENEEMVIWAEQSLSTFVECSLRAKNAPTIIPAEEGET